MANDPFNTPVVQPGREVPQRPTSESSRGAQKTGSSEQASAESESRSPAVEGDGGEKVRISQAARELLRQSELMDRARESLTGAEDVRRERIQQVKERLDAGVYDTKGVRDELAERLTDILGDLPYHDSERDER